MKNLSVIRGLEQVSSEERLRDLELFSLEREGSGETLSQTCNTQRKLIRKMEIDFLQGP